MEENGLLLATKLHTPPELQMISNYAHWTEGTIFLTVALILFLKFMKRIQDWKADVLWNVLILFAGVFLFGFILLHHPLNELNLVWQIMTNDQQQRQHAIMAALFIVVASIQLLGIMRSKKSSFYPERFAFPFIISIIGMLFINHPQHGTEEAIAYMKPYHTFLGSAILATGISSLLSILKKKRIFELLTIIFLSLSSFLLLLYREPAGAYDMTTVTHGGSVKNLVSLIDTIRSKNLEVIPSGEVTQDFFSVKGTAIAIKNQQIQVFEYPSNAEAQKDAMKISEDGSSIGTSMVTWIEPPHFYHKERLIVLYLGNDKEVISILESALGKQIAGRE